MGDFYLEDDDELRKMRERFQMSSPAQVEYGAAIGGGDYGAPPRELDPRLVQSFLAQRPEAEPSRGGYPIPQRESPSFLEDYGLPIAAGVADLIANRGRGLGQITQGVIAGKESRRNREAQQFENDRSAYMKQQDAQAEAEARKQSYGLYSQNAALRQAELDLNVLREKRITDQFLAQQPTAEQLQAERAAELRLKNAQAMKAEADAKRDPDALTPYEKAQLEDRDLDRQARKDLADAARENTATTKQAAADVKEDARKQTVLRQYNKDTEKYVPMAASMRDVDNVITKLRRGDPNADIPGIGATGTILSPFTTLTPEGKIIRNARDNMADDLLRIKSGTAAPPAETAKIERALAPGATDADFLVGYEAWRNIIQGSLKRFGVGREDLARESLRAADLEDWVYGASPQPEAAAMAPPPVRLGGQRGVPGGGNNFDYSGPPAGDVLPVQSGKVPRVDDYLEDLKRRTKTPGVVYRP